MNSEFKYTGIVTVKQKRGNRFTTIYSSHNDGNNNLFKLLAKFLSAQSLSENDLPQQIDIRTSESIDGTYTSVLTSPLFITKSFKVSDGKYYCVNECLLYFSNLNQSAVSNFCKLVLIDGFRNDLAECSINSSVLTSIYSGMQLLISWSLNISN